MNTKRIILLGFVFILMFNIGFIDFSVNGAVNAGTIVSKQSSTAPIIDGIVNDTVWSTSDSEDITLYNYADQLDTVTITIYSLYVFLFLL